MDVEALIGILTELAPGLSTEGMVNIESEEGKARTVFHIGICVDPTEQNIAAALVQGIEILISYHPWQGEAQKVIKSGKLGVISLHEAWDYAMEGVSVTFAKAIGLNWINSAKGVVTGEVNLTLRELIERCQRVLSLNVLPFAGELKSVVKKVGIAPGPGFLPNNKRVWEECLLQGCDTILSSELSLLPLRYASATRVKLVDLGHSTMAKPSMTRFHNALKDQLKDFSCSVEFLEDLYSCKYYTNCYLNDEYQTVESLTLFPVMNKME